MLGLLATATFGTLATRILGQSQPSGNSALVERAGDTGFIQLQADSVKVLDPRQQALAYWLTQASIAIDPIIYDQLSRFGIRQKRLLEELLARPAGVPPDVASKIRTFALLFWSNRGNHNEITAQKFLPSFTFDELKQAATATHAAAASGRPTPTCRRSRQPPT